MSTSPPPPARPHRPSARRRLILLAVCFGGLCALFLGVLGDPPATKPKPDPNPSESGPDGVPRPPVRLQGIEAVRLIARTAHDVRLTTRDIQAAAGVAQGGMDRVFSESPDARRALLIEALGDPDPDVQWVALVAIFRYGRVDGRLMKILLVRSMSAPDLVRGAALTALRGVRQADRQARSLLAAALDTAQGPQWAAVIHALIQIQPSLAFKPRLLAALGDGHVEVRRAAARGLARINLSPEQDPFEHGDALAPMIRSMDDPDSDVRMWIAQGLSTMRYEAAPAIEVLVAHLADAAPHVSDWAKTALGEIGPAALPAMNAILVAGDRSRAAGAAYVLRRVGGEASIAILKRGIEHAEAVIRVRSMMALRDIDPRTTGAIAVYEEALRTADLQAVRLALEGLLRLGADAHPAKAAVEPLIDHEDALVSAKARSILAAISQKGRR